MNNERTFQKTKPVKKEKKKINNERTVTRTETT